MSNPDPRYTNQKTISSFSRDKFRAELISDEDGPFVVIEGSMLDQAQDVMEFATWLSECHKFMKEAT